jgi:thiamine kinase-like enzyme
MEKRTIDVENIRINVKDWEKCSTIEDLHIERMPGLSNYTMKVEDKGKTLIYRIFTNYFSILLNREFETKLLKTLQPIVFCPKVLHSEKTFRIEEFLPYPTVTSKEILNDITKMKMVMYRIADLHNLPNNKDFKNFISGEKIDQTPKIKVAVFDQALKQLISQRLDSPSSGSEEERKAREEISNLWNNEILSLDFQHKMQGLIKKLDSIKRITFCHNDLNNGNFLYDEGSKHFYFLDYEFAGFNYRGYDLANFFNEMTMEYDYPIAPYFKANPELYPKESTLTEVLGHYILGGRKFACLTKEARLEREREYIEKSFDEVREVFEQTGEVDWFDNEIKSLREEIRYAQALGQYFWMHIAYLSLDFEDLHFDMSSYIKLKYAEIQRILSEIL